MGEGERKKGKRRGKKVEGEMREEYMKRTMGHHIERMMTNTKSMRKMEYTMTYSSSQLTISEKRNRCTKREESEVR